MVVGGRGVILVVRWKETNKNNHIIATAAAATAVTAAVAPI